MSDESNIEKHIRRLNKLREDRKTLDEKDRLLDNFLRENPLRRKGSNFIRQFTKEELESGMSMREIMNEALRMIGGKTPDTLRGHKIQFIGFDECAEIPEELFKNYRGFENFSCNWDEELKTLIEKGE